MTGPDFVAAGRRVATGHGWQWIVDSWDFMGRQRGTFIGLFVLYLLLLIGVGIVPGGGLATTLFGPVLMGGILIGCEALRRGERLELAHLFAGFRSRLGPLIGIGALTLAAAVLLAVVAVALLGGAYYAFGTSDGADIVGMLAFVVVGILTVLIVLALSVPLYMAVFFAPALIVFHDVPLQDALKTSFRACWRNMLPFLVWGLCALLLAVPATLLLGLGWLLLGPVLVISMYVSYRDIFLAT